MGTIRSTMQSFNIVTWSLKAGIVEPEKKSIARQRLCKQMFAETDTQATIEELLRTVFSMRSVQNGYEEEFSRKSAVGFPCGAGVEYLHRSPASRRRRRKGSHESETVKYNHESHRTRTRKWLRWRGPAAIVNDRPVFTSERAVHINKPATVWQ
jgi:hypothetical protein